MFASLHQLPPLQYSQLCGLWAGSIRGTVHHLIIADYLWYGRHVGTSFVAGVDTAKLSALWASSSPASAWHESLPGTDLRVSQRLVHEQCARWGKLLATMTEAQADGTFSYTTTSNEERVKHRGACIAHNFNHNTHHRGQISAVITQFGLPAQVRLHFLQVCL